MVANKSKSELASEREDSLQQEIKVRHADRHVLEWCFTKGLLKSYLFVVLQILCVL